MIAVHVLQVCFILLTPGERTKLESHTRRAQVCLPCFKWLCGHWCVVCESMLVRCQCVSWPVAWTEVWPATCVMLCSVSSLLKWKQMRQAVSVVQREPRWVVQLSQVDRHTWRDVPKLRGGYTQAGLDVIHHTLETCVNMKHCQFITMFVT